MTSRKKPDNREDRIVWRLENMRQFSQQLKESDWHERDMAAQDKYIRVCGESVRVVSLADDSALCRFQGLGPGKSVAALATRAQKNLSSEGMDKAVATAKEERRLQAYLIKSALLNNREMLGTLTCLSGKLKSLLFAYDEISFGDKSFRLEVENNEELKKNRKKTDIVRLDILAVGINKSGESFPVIIELKSRRSNADLKTLGKQLGDATKELIGEKCRKDDVPARLLESATGIRPTKPYQVMKILVWPAGRDTHQLEETLKAQHKDQITVIEYSVGSNFPSSTEFKSR